MNEDNRALTSIDLDGTVLEIENKVNLAVLINKQK